MSKRRRGDHGRAGAAAAHHARMDHYTDEKMGCAVRVILEHNVDQLGGCMRTRTPILCHTNTRTHTHTHIHARTHTHTHTHTHRLVPPTSAPGGTSRAVPCPSHPPICFLVPHALSFPCSPCVSHALVLLPASLCRHARPWARGDQGLGRYTSVAFFLQRGLPMCTTQGLAVTQSLGRHTSAFS
jgi:hypothetical protein